MATCSHYGRTEDGHTIKFDPCPWCEVERLKEEVRLWKDRYASLFSWAVVASMSGNPDKHKMDDSQREIFHRWYGEVSNEI